MDETLIEQLIKQILEAKMPEWRSNYANQIAYNLQVHTKGLMLDKVTHLNPNEHPDSRKHCIQSYESITKGSMWKAINNVIRVFNNSSYNIQISEKTKSVIEDYQANEGSLFSQFLEDWIKYAMAEDPNGICVIYPPDYTDDLYRYVCHTEIKTPPTDDLLIFVSLEESEYKVEFADFECDRELFYDPVLGGAPNARYAVVKTFNRRLQRKIINPVYHVFTKEFFVRFYKDDPGQSEFQYTWYKLPDAFESIPYFENGGIEIDEEIYESFLHPFIPFGNLSLSAHRNQRAVELMFYYPRMSEVQTPCDECHGTGRMRYEDEDNGKEVMCHSCKGSKYVSIQSPYKVYKKVVDSFDTDNKIYSTPSVEFYSPDAEILKVVQSQWEKYLEQAEEAVFVQQQIKTGDIAAYKSKELDREGLYAWLFNISKVFFNNLEIFLQALENYVNKSPITVSVEKPYSFAILTESEAFEALSTLLVSDAPVLLKASQVDNFVNKFVSESSPVKRALQILKKFDLLLYYSSAELLSLKGQGIVTSEMVTKHTLSYPILIQMYGTDQTLFEETDEQIIGKLTVEVAKYNLTNDLKKTLLNNQQQQPGANG